MFKLFVLVLAALFAVSFCAPEPNPSPVSAYNVPGFYGAYGAAPYPYSTGYVAPFAPQVYGAYQGVPYSGYHYY